MFSGSESEREMPDGPFEDVMSKLTEFSNKFESETTFTPSILSDLMEVKEYCEKMIQECMLARESK
jgi:hypothetical protein